jgi:formylglycine-generating enzyme required for sulfatase activity
LNKYQWADYFTPNAHERLLKSLSLRAQVLGINVSDDKVTKPETEPSVFPAPAGSARYEQYDLYRFIEIEPQKNSKVTYPFWIGKYPITNAQYERFLNAPDFASKIYWLEFPKFDENCQSIGDWGDEGVNWLKEKLKKDGTKKICPRQWDHEHLGKPNKHNPVVGITWFEANAYCEWLLQNWDSEPESKANGMLKPRAIRLPLETEWTTAAGGEDPNNRYPWDEPGKTTSSLKEVLRRANVRESEIEHTTPVTAYPLGKSPFSLMDMAGNVWEWQANNVDEKGMLALRGGAWHNPLSKALITSRDRYVPYGESGIGIGFRVMVIAK